MNTKQYTPRWKHLLVTLLVAALLMPATSIGARAKAEEPDPEIVAAFAAANAHLSRIPRQLFEARVMEGLIAGLAEAKKEFAGGNACAGAARLAGLAATLRAQYDEKFQPALEELHNRLWSLRLDLLSALPADAKCEAAARARQASGVEILKSDAEGIAGRVHLGEPRLSNVTVEGKTFTQLELPGLQTGVGAPGAPGVPFLHRLIALPQGSIARILVRGVEETALTLHLNLYPIQPEPADRSSSRTGKVAFDDPPFTLDKEIYGRDEDFPARVGTLKELGRARGVRMAQLSFAAGQYNPVTRTLKLFTTIEFNVSFSGGKGGFVGAADHGAFESLTHHYTAATLNREIVFESDPIPERLRRLNCGEEFLILTHPDFRAAADALAEWKNEKGIPTSVIEVNDGAGGGPDTRAGIDQLIEGRYNRCGLRPSYLLLMGDAEFIPTFYRNTFGSNTTGTDYPYALLSDEDDDLPDFALGRIPVDTQAEAQIVVDKIIRYESQPPAARSFYERATVASQFQCCRPDVLQEGRDQRSFIETSELVRDSLLDSGYDVDRIYTRTTETNYNGDDTPRRFFDGTLLPSALRAANGFLWDGETQDIVDAINDGRFLVLHRDHGSKDGWAHPDFLTPDIADLDNGELLPVVFSVNCASGLFDNETANGDYGTEVDEIYFSEQLLRREGGGAVGIIGDTRNSPTWANSALTRGLYDAVFPATVDDFGQQRSLRRLGDILNHAKLYLHTQIGVEGTTIAPSEWQVESNLYLWHVLGDPTLEMWTQRPSRPTPLFDLILTDLLRAILKYQHLGTIITVMQRSGDGWIALGRAETTEGTTEIKFIRRPQAGLPLHFVASVENGIAVKLREEVAQK